MMFFGGCFGVFLFLFKRCLVDKPPGLELLCLVLVSPGHPKVCFLLFYVVPFLGVVYSLTTQRTWHAEKLHENMSSVNSLKNAFQTVYMTRKDTHNSTAKTTRHVSKVCFTGIPFPGYSLLAPRMKGNDTQMTCIDTHPNPKKNLQNSSSADAQLRLFEYVRKVLQKSMCSKVCCLSFCKVRFVSIP